MQLHLVQNGKIKDRHIQALRDEFVKRISRYGQLHIHEQTPKGNKSLWPTQARWRVLLDERGESFSSEAFAQQMEQWAMHHGALAFAIGEAYGHDDATRNEADFTMRLSDMVLPHQLAHVFLAEQLYRALCILNNNPYHHGS